MMREVPQDARKSQTREEKRGHEVYASSPGIGFHWRRTLHPLHWPKDKGGRWVGLQGGAGRTRTVQSGSFGWKRSVR